MPEVSDSLSSSQRVSMRELAAFFLRVGCTAFGGAAAHIAMMEDELVRRRQWLSRQKFLDLLGASNLIPGPSSSELAIHIGYLLAGWRGLLMAGTCFSSETFSRNLLRAAQSAHHLATRWFAVICKTPSG